MGTTAFYQRVEVKAAIAFLQCMNNVNQPVWFEKAMLNPSRGVGKTSIEKLINFSIENQITIQDAAYHKDCPLQQRFIDMIQSFLTLIENANQLNSSLDEKFDWILTEVKFNDHLKKLENTKIELIIYKN